jgi:hypothetical protein
MSLSFQRIAKESFDALAEQHGLTLVYESEVRLEYTSKRVRMLVNFDNGRSYEFAVAFNLVGSEAEQQPYSLAEVLRLKKHAEATSIEGQQIDTQSGLDAALKRAARLASEYASEQLDGSAEAFEQLAKQRAAEAREYGLARDLRAARFQADRAWQEKDFATVVRLYRPLLSHLSPSEVKRFEFASAHTDKNLKNCGRD